MKDYSSMIKNIRKHLKDYCVDNKLRSLIIGVSGGIDSALCCALAEPVCKELKIPLIGRSISIDSNGDDEKSRAVAVGEAFCSDFIEIDLTGLYDKFEKCMEPGNQKISLGNLKARMRMCYLYDLAWKNSGIVLSTDNYTEYLLGFWTSNGDVGDFGMVQNLWKAEVYELSEFMCEQFSISDKLKNKHDSLMSCIVANATDGLGISSTDLDQIMPDWTERHSSTREGYCEVDKILKDYVVLEKINVAIGFNESQKRAFKYLGNTDVVKRYLATNFKRNVPVNICRMDIV